MAPIFCNFLVLDLNQSCGETFLLTVHKYQPNKNLNRFLTLQYQFHDPHQNKLALGVYRKNFIQIQDPFHYTKEKILFDQAYLLSSFKEQAILQQYYSTFC